MLFNFIFLKMRVAIWFDINWVCVGEEVDVVLDGTTRRELCGLGEDGGVTVKDGGDVGWWG